MSTQTLESVEFRRGDEGATVEVALPPLEYARLLAKSRVTDEGAWPPELRQGARLLASIQQIEAECIGEHGSWDWELVPAKQQDEYDMACARLRELLDPDDPGTPLEEALRELGL